MARKMSREQAALMAKLLSVFPAVVPETDLIAAIWPGMRPKKPKATLHSLIHNLRKLGCPIVNKFNVGYAIVPRPKADTDPS